MKIQKCIILENNTEDLITLQTYIGQISSLELLGSFQNPLEAMHFLQQHSVDLFFLEIGIADFNGLDLIKTLPNPPSTIVISAEELSAKVAFEFGVSDYLPKPLGFKHFLKAVNRHSTSIRPLRADSNDFIFLKVGRQLQKFSFESIQFVAAYGTYSKIYTSDQCYLISESISKLTQKFPDELFVRIHKSYLVPLYKITSFDTKNIWISEVKLPLGATFQKDFYLSPLSLFA